LSTVEGQRKMFKISILSYHALQEKYSQFISKIDVFDQKWGKTQ
jgi:hypothetical protein